MLLLCTPFPNHDQAAASERADSKLHQAEQPDQLGDALPQLPQHLVFASVPGAHSRKPHLGRLLQRYLPLSIACLEVWPPPAPHGLWPVTSRKRAADVLPQLSAEDPLSESSGSRDHLKWPRTIVCCALLATACAPAVVSSVTSCEPATAARCTAPAQK